MHILTHNILSKKKTIDLININNCSSPVGTIPLFNVNKDGTLQADITTGTWTKITWPNILFDTNSNFTADKFTPSVEGKYILSTSIRFIGMSSGDQIKAGIYKNGTLYFYSSAQTSKDSTSETVDITRLVTANGTTDYFEIYAKHDFGSNRNISGDIRETLFGGFKVAT